MSENDTPAALPTSDTPEKRHQAFLEAAKKSFSANDALYRKLAEIENTESLPQNSGAASKV